MSVWNRLGLLIIVAAAAAVVVLAAVLLLMNHTESARAELDGSGTTRFLPFDPGGYMAIHGSSAGAKASVPMAVVPSADAALKEIHSPGAVAVDIVLRDRQCTLRVINAAAGEYLPDPVCTPGAIDPAVTNSNVDSTICAAGYTARLRPLADEIRKARAASLRQYGRVSKPTDEFDRLLSLQLGGANAVSNLWPEPNRPNAIWITNPKDSVENSLHAAVCQHRVPLRSAQEALARNWVTALQSLGL